jgi:hypothetical protein
MAWPSDSRRQKALRDFLVEKRKEAGLRQLDPAKRLKRRQDYVSYVETGQKLVEVVELMEWAEAIGFALSPRNCTAGLVTQCGSNLISGRRLRNTGIFL